MNAPGSTCWTVIHGAAAGAPGDRDEFARRYQAVVRSYFHARWHIAVDSPEIDDAVQNVFLECFKDGGVLENVSQQAPPDFRSFLFGVARNVARRLESAWRRAQEVQPPADLQMDRIERSEATLSQAFDRAWAESVVTAAAELQAHLAREQGEEALRRVELLKLRFADGHPIREIARRWGASPRWVHHQYEQARAEFERALLQVIRFHHPGAPDRARRELAQVLALFGAESPSGR